MATIRKTYINEQIMLLELDNPPANTLSKKIKSEFVQIITEIEENTNLRAVIVTGCGTHFCSGGDLKENLQNIGNQAAIIQALRSFTAVIERFEKLSIPIIAAINGWCIGGGFELALCCDIRVAVPNAQFICAGVNVGLTASAYRLPRLIGVARAKRLLLTGGRLKAQQALDYGIITDIFEAEQLLLGTIQLAKTIALKAPLAVKTAKKIANLALDMPVEQGWVFQQQELERLAHSQDHQEAVRAFQEKRKPIFKGQ